MLAGATTIVEWIFSVLTLFHMRLVNVLVHSFSYLHLKREYSHGNNRQISAENLCKISIIFFLLPFLRELRAVYGLERLLCYYTNCFSSKILFQAL